MSAPPQANSTQPESLHNAYIQLLKEEGLWQGDISLSLRTVVNRCAEHLHVQRVSLWRFAEGYDRLYCQMLCDIDKGTYEPALELLARDHQPYFNAMLNDRVLAAHDA